ncbi:hypothetical protein FGG79_05230 [Bacillus sp. BHET2]|uniref:hypothetical protein n=1 Tax=Bacillus sp. BHET2 TaxID=2583818 RepID=UPI00110DA529|nr:hypothetical protein [Bacillus sp. BHET2]TMU87529.1 hypothetical protein FGG79_05230 [Bacillus sp. BHET2]
MNGVINAIKLNQVMEYEDLFHQAYSPSRLKAGQVKQINYHIQPNKNELSYEIANGEKVYVNVEDAPCPPSIVREELSYQTLFHLKQPIDIEIAGVKRSSIIISIQVSWLDEGNFVSYGVKDRTDTTYFGVRQERLVEWNPIGR